MRFTHAVFAVQASVLKASFPVALLCFIAPPSIEELERRLRARGTETEETLATRIRNASREMEEAAKLPFTIRIINDDVELAYQQLKLAVEPLLMARRKVRRGVSAAAPPLGGCVVWCRVFVALLCVDCLAARGVCPFHCVCVV